MLRSALIEHVIGSRPVRQAADWMFSRYAARRVAQVDRLRSAECQFETLRALLGRAGETKFGRDHRFDRIRTMADYQRHVPLRRYEDFWRDYWQPAFPAMHNVTWPGPLPYVALSSGTTSGATKYIPVSREMLRSNRRAAFTGLAWFHCRHPEARLFAGRTLFLGGSTDLRPAAQGTAPAEATRLGDLSGIAAREFPALMRPFVFPPLDVALSTDWDAKLERIAEESVSLPITAVSGVPSWLLALFERMLRLTGKAAIAEIWPSLRLVIHGGTRFDPYRKLFRQVVGDGVRYLETYPASEGFVAAEDSRYEHLRLIPDHGVFFEFVPVDELDDPRPARHTLADAVPGVQYAVVLTTCAGLWSYVLGDTVCFESISPPLLRFTGRTSQFLSAFGEHLIGDEVERAVAAAAEATNAAVVDFHVGPVFPGFPGEAGRHRYFVEFAEAPASTYEFAVRLDATLARINEDYAAHRVDDLTMQMPEVVAVPPGGFAEWMRARGKLGGQHKVPRMDNSGQLTDNLGTWLQREWNCELPRSA